MMKLDIIPCSKPRMTRADKWKKRQSVVKFFAFRDAIRQSEYMNPHDCLSLHSFDIEFHVPMPKSWSKKKKALYNGVPHMQRPDLDNYIKAWCDSVFEEDSVVWKIHASKLWAETGYIKIGGING